MAGQHRRYQMDDTEKRRQSAELNARDLAPVLTRGGPAPASSFSFFIFILMGLPLRNTSTHSGPSFAYSYTTSSLVSFFFFVVRPCRIGTLTSFSFNFNFILRGCLEWFLGSATCGTIPPIWVAHLHPRAKWPSFWYLFVVLVDYFHWFLFLLAVSFVDFPGTYFWLTFVFVMCPLAPCYWLRACTWCPWIGRPAPGEGLRRIDVA